MSKEVISNEENATEDSSSAPAESRQLTISDAVPKRMEPHPIYVTVASYIDSIRSIGQTVKIVLPHLSNWITDEYKKQEKIISNYVSFDTETDVPQRIALKTARDYAEFTRAIKNIETLAENRSVSVLARSLFMQMFCEFDAFTGALLKNIYSRNESLLKGISREISFQDLIEYKDIESIKKSILDKEIETFRRDSYVDQFGQLEKKFSISLKKFPEWCEFVELSQRRNLFVHNDGLVSEQYLVVCDREGYKFSKRPNVGDPLSADIEYFDRALRVISKVGFMLGHTLWSKVLPKDKAAIHESINEILYACLEHKRWGTASELGEFALSEPMRRDVSEVELRVRAINVAIGLKFSGQDDAASKLIKSFDWSASYRDFKLAIFVLEEDYEKACEMMESIGRVGEIISQPAYHTWPLFHRFRDRQDFYEIYERIYGEPYAEKVRADGAETSVSISTRSTASSKKKAREEMEDVVSTSKASVFPKPKKSVKSKKQ